MAVTRGPIVYCLEETDNGKGLHELLVDPDLQPEIRTGEICGNEVTQILVNGFRVKDGQDTGLYHTYQAPRKEPVRLHYIPYYTWANRGENEMQVWTRVKE